MKLTQKLGLLVILIRLAFEAHSQTTDSASSPTSVPDSIVQVTADAQGLPLLPSDQVPQYGTFWVITPVGSPQPWPVRPPNLNLPTYGITDSAFLVDATGEQVFTRGQPTADAVTAALATMATNVVNVINEVQGAQVEQEFAAAMGMDTMSMDSAMGGGALTPDGSSSPGAIVDYGTNLWIAQMGVTNGYLTGIGSNTFADVQYEIQSSTNLAQIDWQSEGFIFGSEATNWTPLSIPQLGRTNLFIRLKSWANSDGTGIPDWWEQEYGLTNVDANAQDSAGDGYTIYQKYVLNVNPGTWITPAAPQGLAVAHNANAGTANLTWLPSPGNVSGYVVEKTYTYAWSNMVQDFTVSAPAYTDNLSANYPNPWQGGTISVSYTVQAIYGSGRSAGSAPVPLEAPSFGGSINSDPQGNVVLAVATMPNNTTGIRLTEIDNGAIWNGDFADAFVTNFVISVTNAAGGIIPLPNVQTPDSDSDLAWEGQALQSDGNESANAPLGGTFEGDGNSTAFMEPNFYDERRLLKENLIFQLRAAPMGGPLHFTISPVDQNGVDIGAGSFGAYVGGYTYATNYAYAGLYQFANQFSHSISPLNYGTLDPFLPSEENCLFRNLVYAPSETDTNGALTTGVEFGGYSYYYYNEDYCSLAYPLGYEFQTNWTEFPDLLETNAAVSLVYDQEDHDDVPFLNGLINITHTQSPFVDSMAMSSGLQNWFGLPYVSTTISYPKYQNTNYIGVATNIIMAGQTIQIDAAESAKITSEDGSYYLQTAQPGLQMQEYDFWSTDRIFDPNSQTWVTRLPGDPTFVPTNSSQLLIAGVGSQIQIAGYAKLLVTSSVYPGTYGYLGQYFQQAYTTTNGVATSIKTGVLSPYGSFIATEPGDAALVTMPDVDTGVQGTGIVHCVSLQVDKNHDGIMDLTLSGADATSPTSPLIFWVNNNYDRSVPDSDDNTFYDDDVLDTSRAATCPYTPTTPAPDCNYRDQFGSRAIPNERDLQDYARLWVCGMGSNVLSLLPLGSSVTLSRNDVVEKEPPIGN